MQRNDQESERPLYASLRYDVRKKLGLGWGEYVLLDMVYHLSAKHGYCYKTVSSIANDLGITFTGAKKMIARLIDRELLIVKNNGFVCGSSYIDCAYLTKDGNTTESELSSERTKKNQTKFRKAEKPETLQNMQNQTKFKKVNLVAKSELSSDKNNNIDIHIENSTKVLLASDDAPAVYGKPEINELFEYWETKTGVSIQAKLKPNRYAASSLLKRYGADGVRRLVDGAVQARGQRYPAPQISDFTELQRDLNRLLSWGKDRMTQTPKVVKI